MSSSSHHPSSHHPHHTIPHYIILITPSLITSSLITSSPHRPSLSHPHHIVPHYVILITPSLITSSLITSSSHRPSLCHPHHIVPHYVILITSSSSHHPYPMSRTLLIITPSLPPHPSLFLSHCSTSVGPSGIFCALWHCIERLRLEKVVDVFQAVQKLQLQKPGMVETVKQYAFIYDCVHEFINLTITTTTTTNTTAV